MPLPLPRFLPARPPGQVIVDEGINTVSYALDESLIYFGAALEDQDYERAVATLEPLELTPETEAQWNQLADQAMKSNQVGEGGERGVGGRPARQPCPCRPHAHAGGWWCTEGC